MHPDPPLFTTVIPPSFSFSSFTLLPSGVFVAGDVVPLVLEGEVAPFAAVGVLDGDVGGQGDDGVPQGDSGARCGGRLLRMHQAKCSISSR
jgi:hypothetical protein